MVWFRVKPKPPRFDGPYNSRTFIRSVNANQLYNNNTPPQSHPKPPSSTSKPNPSVTHPQPKSLETHPQPKPLQIQPQSTQPKPQPAEPKPQPTEPKPQPTEPKPQPTEPKLQPTQPKPQPTEPKPQTSQPKSQPKPEPQPSQPQPKPQPSQVNPQPPRPKPQGLQPQPQPSYFIPTQIFYNSYYQCNYQQFQYVTMYYAQENIYYAYQPDPTFYLNVDVLGPMLGLVWIYPYNQQIILVPDDYYYDQTPFQYAPIDMLLEPDGEIFPGSLENRHFFPEDTEACLYIVEALLPLQIATYRLPGFFQFVKKPVILGNIKHRLLKGKYTRIVDVVHDLRAIVWNISYYLTHLWEDWAKEENEAFSQALERQLSMYYPGYNFGAITGNPDHKPE